MPILLEKNVNNITTIGIWEIKECLQELSGIALTPILSKKANKINHLQKKKQFWASIHLIHHFKCELNNIHYDNNGKPLLKNGSHISISHSKDLVAVAICPNNIGVDIEKISPKVRLVTSKFENTKLHNNLSDKELTAIWTIKESCYKYANEKGLSLKTNISISPTSTYFHAIAEIKTKEQVLPVISNSFEVNDFICTIVISK